MTSTLLTGGGDLLGGSPSGTSGGSPREFLILPGRPTNAVSSFVNMDAHGSSWYQARIHNGGGGVLNSYIEWQQELDAGTWSFTLLHDRGSDRGIATVSIDGTSVFTADAYAASPVENIATTGSGIVVASAGQKLVRITMATKNASSTGYFFGFQGLSGRRTGA